MGGRSSRYVRRTEKSKTTRFDFYRNRAVYDDRKYTGARLRGDVRSGVFAFTRNARK